MIEDPDLRLIVRAASTPSVEATQEQLMREISAHCYGLGYASNKHPAIVALFVTVTARHVCEAMLEMSEQEWRHMQTRIADLLEREAHEEAA